MKRKISAIANESTDYCIEQLKRIYEEDYDESPSTAQLLREGLLALYFIRKAGRDNKAVNAFLNYQNYVISKEIGEA